MIHEVEGPIEVIDDINELFIQFDILYFNQTLSNTGVRLEWSNRMTRCAGLCQLKKCGDCVIRLSAKLLKFRSAKNVKETLAHEMIHAYLFRINVSDSRDGHGPAFQKKMFEINKSTGLSITVYHDFLDEVQYHQKHIWKCQGPCAQTPPYFGIVQRAMNRAPSKNDPWFKNHQRACGGSYIKVSSPEKQVKKKIISGNHGLKQTVRKIEQLKKKESEMPYQPNLMEFLQPADTLKRYNAPYDNGTVIKKPKYDDINLDSVFDELNENSHFIDNNIEKSYYGGNAMSVICEEEIIVEEDYIKDLKKNVYDNMTGAGVYDQSVDDVYNRSVDDVYNRLNQIEPYIDDVYNRLNQIEPYIGISNDGYVLGSGHADKESNACMYLTEEGYSLICINGEYQLINRNATDQT